MAKDIKNVDRILFGRGALNQLGQLLQCVRAERQGNVVFLIDHFFQDKALVNQLPKEEKDLIYFIDTKEEPTTDLINHLTYDKIARSQGHPAAIIGIGGGSVLDTAKAVANVLTNGGKAEDYQGWDLVKVPSVYKIGIPTLSGTGSETSRTCVLSNKKKGIKLGMNSNFSVYDQLILDPDLTATVPRDQYFYTGMDTYLHCIEYLNGRNRDIFTDSYSYEATRLCREIFLSDDMMSPENREKMMVASMLGGAAAGNVGLVHPLSAGLSIALGTHHCVANCIVMNALEEYYPDAYREFMEMVRRQRVRIPSGVCKNLSDETYKKLFDSSIVHSKPLTNALGENYKKILTYEKVISLFKQM